jgi:hypothetical protein
LTFADNTYDNEQLLKGIESLTTDEADVDANRVLLNGFDMSKDTNQNLGARK